jgi:hypothetical protein
MTLFHQEPTETTPDDYYTPKWVFDALGVTFDLDVASPPGGPPFVPCRRYYTLADDGLTQPWDGLVWMNPPYSKPAPWIDRFLNHGNGIALLPVTRSKWATRLWESDATAVFPAITTIKFNRPQIGLVEPPGPWMLVFWATGETAKEALRNSNIGTVR